MHFDLSLGRQLHALTDRLVDDEHITAARTLERSIGGGAIALEQPDRNAAGIAATEHLGLSLRRVRRTDHAPSRSRFDECQRRWAQHEIAELEPRIAQVG